jgi:hypothetical protein
VNLTQEISSKKLSKTETVFFDLTTIKINSSGEIIHNQLFSDFEINEALKSGLIKYGNIYQLQPYFTDNKSNQDFLVKITRLSMTSSAKENGANSITVNAFAELYQSNSPKKIRSKFFSLSKEKNVVMNDQLEQKKIISTLIEGLTERIDIWINKRIYKLQKN